MASEWAEEADRQAKAITRDLVEVGKSKGYRVAYQKREARFMLRAGTVTNYFSAHDYNTPKGMDWLQLRIDVLKAVKKSTGQNEEQDYLVNSISKKCDELVQAHRIFYQEKILKNLNLRMNQTT
ncbi:MAG TPA: hypothetical protein VEQ34_07865 [Pyrinomonadaceae bacterium]|nr:hypothetical protein [Pyrinomonadaceae bacterium]